VEIPGDPVTVSGERAADAIALDAMPQDSSLSSEKRRQPCHPERSEAESKDLLDPCHGIGVRRRGAAVIREPGNLLPRG